MTPGVLIAANPYEAELCRKALADTGVATAPCESIEDAMTRLAAGGVLAVVIADGWSDADARELLVEVRSAYLRMPIFFLGDRDGDIVDEDAAIRRGASRLFLRPIEAQAFADAIEKLAVEAELAGEISAQIEAGRSVEPLPQAETQPAILPRESTQIIAPGATEVVAANDVGEHAAPMAHASQGAWVPEALDVRDADSQPVLLRADDAMDEVGRDFDAITQRADFMTVPSLPAVQAPATATPPEAVERAPSPLSQRLSQQISEVERRLFPDAPAAQKPARAAYDDYDDALSDIDLDKLGVDTLPGIPIADLMAASLRAPTPALPASPTARTVPGMPAQHALAARPAQAATEPQLPAAAPRPSSPPLPEEGSLGARDLCELLCALHAAGWSGRFEVTRGDGEKSIYFDGGQPVFATSSFPHDRLGDLLYREGKLTREQHARTRELTASPGRQMANTLIDLGLLKMKELFPTLRRQMEEIIYSLFAWEHGEFRLTPDQAPVEERLRMAQHPRALFFEGVRRKYGLERLVDLVGPASTVVQRAAGFEQALVDAALSETERHVVEAADGQRPLGELGRRGIHALMLSETGLYAITWALMCMNALRHSDGNTVAVNGPTLVGVKLVGERRQQERREDKIAADDSALDRERLLAKRAQIDEADYFAILGVDVDATQVEIDRAWERLRRDFDVARFTPDIRADLEDTLSEIAEVLDEAHRVLHDDHVRRAYREHLDVR